METFLCPKCAKHFTYKKNLIKHERNGVCVKTELKDKNFVKCPESDCQQVFSCRELFRNHVQTDHGVNLEIDKLLFRTYEDFTRWKCNLEKEKLSYYHIRSTQTANDVKRVYLDCHRSGYFISKSKNHRKLKRQGTNKIGSICTSFMKVVAYTGYVDVTFCGTHFGHGPNLSRCCLTKEERIMIADKIKEGVNIDRIFDEILNRINGLYVAKSLPTKCSFMNVCEDINLIEDLSHNSDYVNVRMWVENNLKVDRNPIIYHDLSETDFILILSNDFQLEMLKLFGVKKICIDCTPSANECDMHLTTIVVLDEFGNGFPTVFCVSLRNDIETWKLLFQKVKEKIGIIQSEIFMSDDDHEFYDAWTEVMTDVDRVLLCSWHVDQAWRHQIQSGKIKGSLEKKCQIYKTLKILHQEPELANFEELLKVFSDDLYADKDTFDFAEYFQNNYIHRAKEWAYCHRRVCGIDKNVYLESIHKQLESFYSQGIKIKRLDKCLNALQKLIRDRVFSRFTKLENNQYTLTENDIVVGHETATKIPNNKIKQISENLWNVCSNSDENLFYDVTKIGDVCSVIGCQPNCQKCNICTHLYVCDCPDHVLRSNICKHIHGCILTSSKHKNVKKNPDVSNIIKNFKSCPAKKEPQTSEIKMKIIQQINTFLDIMSTYEFASEDYDFFKKKIDSMMNIARQKKRKVAEVQEEHIDLSNGENISYETISFSPKKKKNIEQPSEQNSSLNENTTIIETISVEEVDGRNSANLPNDSHSDHCYS